MQIVEVNAIVRQTTGKAEARRVRNQGRVPAVFYGPGRSTTLLSVDSKEFTGQVLNLEGSHLIRFASEDTALGGSVALVKETQFHPLSGAAMHVDFYEVNMNAPIQVPVPLHFVGKAAGVVLGGILQPIRREIDVECLPSLIPEYLEVDVTALGIHDTVHVGQLALPEGVAAIWDVDFALVTVSPPSVAEAKADEAAPAEGAAEAKEPTEAAAAGKKSGED